MLKLTICGGTLSIVNPADLVSLWFPTLSEIRISRVWVPGTSGVEAGT